MSVALVTYGSDRRLLLGAAEAVRKPIYAAGYNTIRIGLQCTMDGTLGNLTGTPRLAFGVCSGNSNVLAAATATHVVGWKNHVATWTDTLSGFRYLVGSSSTQQMFKKINTTETTALTSVVAAHKISNDTSVRGCLIIEIKKSASTAINLICGTTFAVDTTDQQFQSAMEATTMANALLQLPSGYSNLSTASMFTIDEATNGDLDNIFVYWDRTATKFSFNLRHRMIN